jgi:hypothetical protein
VRPENLPHSLGSRLAACALPAAVLLCVPAVSTAATQQPPADIRQWHFTVLLDGKPIGEHDFTVTGRAGELDVESRAHFRVKALFIPVYAYDHQDHELWRGGCLAQIDAHTDENGKELAVHGQLAGNAFDVHGPQGAQTLPACVQTFAYWDARFLAAHQLLNAQTGKYESVRTSRLADTHTRANGHDVQAEHYSLMGSKMSVELWYSLAGQWLSLETRTEQGRTLRYEMR